MNVELREQYMKALQDLICKWLQHHRHISVNTLEFAKDIMQNICEPVYYRGGRDTLARWLYANYENYERNAGMR